MEVFGNNILGIPIGLVTLVTDKEKINFDPNQKLKRINVSKLKLKLRSSISKSLIFFEKVTVENAMLKIFYF